MFPSNVYVKRRKRLMKQVESGLILLLGNEESPANYTDNPYHFRQDSTFLYFFGINFPELAGVIDVDEQKELIFGNDFTIDDVVWMGAQPTIKERSEKSSVTDTAPLAKLEKLLKKAKDKNRKIHFLPPYRPENKIKLMNLLDISPSSAQKLASVELIQAVVNQRNIKSDEEIEEIEYAVNTTVDMHLAAMRMARPGIFEKDIAGAMAEIALASGGQLAYPIIATINGQTLHNHYHGNQLKSGDMLLVDAGAESPLCYAGDLSSTIPVDKNFTDRQKEIYRITLNAHIAAVDALKPGKKFREIHLMACRTIAEGMKDLGMMKGNLDDAVEEGAHALFFPCGLGHMMGLDVHDMEDLGEVYVGYDGQPKSTLFGIKSLRLARELQSGFVLTIEPGVYFIPQLIDMWKAENKFAEFINYDKVEPYKKFGGIRNEENFVITEDGYRLLGKPLAKTIEEVEAVRAS